MNSFNTPARVYAAGQGEAVADRTINRKVTVRVDPPRVETFAIPRRDDISLDSEIAAWAKSKGFEFSHYVVTYGDGVIVSGDLLVTAETRNERWEDVAERVAFGNSFLFPVGEEDVEGLKEQRREFHAMNHHLRQASVLMSGRHLQHGDETQPGRNMEILTNCSSSAASFILFYLLLNGSGVGRSYDDDMILADMNRLPIVIPVIDWAHKDVQSGKIKPKTARDVEHFYAGRTITKFEVPDSREGWAKAVELMETMAFECRTEEVLILDFSQVRPYGSKINGMQGRPASGPAPLMEAIEKVATLRKSGMEPWRATMFADHYLAECVLVGGARRAARMATKDWRDKTVFGFIELKRGGFLYSSNNSVTVDAEFWGLIKSDSDSDLAKHAKKVFEALTKAAYYDQTGEPGIINVDRISTNNEGLDALFDGKFAESDRYKLDEGTLALTSALAKAVSNRRYTMTVNPCGEIPLSLLGAYCTIADVVPFFSQNDADAEDAFRVATRALIRVNTMNSLYGKEVRRTNRIGVGITGLHEYAWKRFGFAWKDIIDEKKSKEFWLMLSRFKRAVQEEAKHYSAELGLNVPHTDTCMKPAGTTSKLFGLTEGAHLPSMREYLRWVQFRNDDPLVSDYEEKGYPVRHLTTYSGTTIVGFPTVPLICSLGLGDKLVTAAEATPEEQYQYLRLCEKYFMTGVDEDGEPLRETGGQISYTLKYDPNVLSYEEFCETLKNGQSTVRCCSVMPQSDTSAYEYQPEEPVTKAQFEMIAAAIERASNGQKVKEDVGAEHVDCAGGACPVSFNENEAAA